MNSETISIIFLSVSVLCVLLLFGSVLMRNKKNKLLLERLGNKDESSAQRLDDGKSKFLTQRIGEAIAILCARYCYRGIIAEVHNDSVVLSNPYAVETTGLATAARATTETPIPSDVCILFGAIELIYQPVWCFHGYEKKKK